MRTLKQKLIVSLMISLAILSIVGNNLTKQNERRETALKIFSLSNSCNKYMEGVDFNKPVKVIHIKIGDEFIQYQTKSAPQGNFYGVIGSTPDELGISEKGYDPKTKKVVMKEMRIYKAVRENIALSSYAAPVKDDHSTPEIETQTKGGKEQLFALCKPCFILTK